MQDFLGIINFFHRFIPNTSAIMWPLYVSTKGKAKLVTWSEDMVNAFSLVKHSLATATLLILPQAVSPMSITVDASNIAIGGVLEQFINDQWRPLAFFS